MTDPTVLGLAKEVVRLVPHRPQWAAAFAAERARLEPLLASVDCQIEHVGSTAVPGLEAKPILDIAIGLARGQAFEPVVPRLESAAYEYRGDAGGDGGQVFVRESSPLVRTHHVHVVARDDPQWERYLRFRELLRSDAEARQRYQREKRALAARHPRDRLAYTEGKSDVVLALLAL